MSGSEKGFVIRPDTYVCIDRLHNDAYLIHILSIVVLIISQIINILYRCRTRIKTAHMKSICTHMFIYVCRAAQYCFIKRGMYSEYFFVEIL